MKDWCCRFVRICGVMCQNLMREGGKDGRLGLFGTWHGRASSLACTRLFACYMLQQKQRKERCGDG